VLAPENWDRLPEVRAASPVPLAVGELTTSMNDAVRLIRDHGVDFIRSHVSDIGGLTPARKLADLAELCGVRTAWHGPGDTSPIGAAANVALDVTSRVGHRRRPRGRGPLSGGVVRSRRVGGRRTAAGRSSRGPVIQAVRQYDHGQ
jgi:L-alanine-DL-glutamate epimerase-like enolase superfamily enzyme